MPFQSTMQGHLGPQSTLVHDQAEIGSAVVPEIEVSSPPKTLAEAGYPHLRRHAKVGDLLVAERDPGVPVEVLPSETSRQRAMLLRGERMYAEYRTVRGMEALGFDVQREGRGPTSTYWVTNRDHVPNDDQFEAFTNQITGAAKRAARKARAARRSQAQAPKPKPAPPAAPPGPPMLLSTLSVVSLSALPGQPPTMMLTDGQTVWGVTITSVSPA